MKIKNVKIKNVYKKRIIFQENHMYILFTLPKIFRMNCHFEKWNLTLKV